MSIALWLIAGFILLYLGGEALVAGSVRLALRAGVAALAVGLTVVALGTSSPELVVSINAAIRGANGIVLGSVVGSNLCNLLLVLGLSAIVRPMQVRRRRLRVDLPVLMAISAALLLALANGVLERWEGIVFVLALAAYTFVRLRRAGGETSEAVDVDDDPPVPELRRVPAPVLLLSGLVLLVAGAHAFVTGAVALARLVGLSETVVGLSVVAVGTSLPESSAAVLAAWRRQGDLAIGNAVGSNMFNILGILGLSAILHPLQRGDVSWIDLGLMAATPLLLMPFAWTGLRLNRWEGVLLLPGYAIFIGWRVVGAI